MCVRESDIVLLEASASAWIKINESPMTKKATREAIENYRFTIFISTKQSIQISLYIISVLGFDIYMLKCAEKGGVLLRLLNFFAKFGRGHSQTYH